MFNTKSFRFSAILTMIGAASAAFAQGGGGAHGQPAAAGKRDPLLLTATNGKANYLAVINTRTKQVDYVATGGVGGVGGNAGGVAVAGDLAAVVNFGSSNVTVFVRQGNWMQPAQVITTASKPVSVAFGSDHLIVLEQTSAESFAIAGNTVAAKSDGNVPLLKGDGSAGQVVAYRGGAIYTEKSGSVGVLNFGIPGLVGPSVPVSGLPSAANFDTPLGMVARGANAYVTIAHSDLELLVTNGAVVSSATGGVPYKDALGVLIHAPCWNALYGQFLYSADSPSKQLRRYLVSDTNVFIDKQTAAKLTGGPTDLDIRGRILGVIDGGDGTNSNASVFNIDSEGELTLRFAVKIAGAINGTAIIE